MFTDVLTLVEEDCAVLGWFDLAGCCAVLVFADPLLFGACCAWLLFGACWAWLFAAGGLLVWA
jgi:hypothetical protein